MKQYSYISESELSRFSDFSEYTGELHKQDIATLMDVLSSIKDLTIRGKIKSVLKNKEGFFLFLIGSSEGSFDFFKYVNAGYAGPETINGNNIKYLCPVKFSSGILLRDISERVEPVNGEAKTGYIDESEIRTSIYANRVVNLKNVSTGEEYQFTDTGFSIGRSSKDADVVVADNNVSRKHCMFFLKNGVPCVRDNDSTNGTFLNARRLSPLVDVMVDIGDTIHIATEEFKIV